MDVLKTIKKVAGVWSNTIFSKYNIGTYFPKMLASGYLEDKNLNFIVMPKYDLDLEKLF